MKQCELNAGSGKLSGRSTVQHGLLFFLFIKERMATEMKIKAQIDRFIGKDNRVKAYASVILGGEYVIRDIAVMDSKNGLFARMPYRSYKDRNGNMQYSDVAFALNETSRNAVSDAVLEAYEQRLHMEEDESQDLEEPDEDEAPVFEQRM